MKNDENTPDKTFEQLSNLWESTARGKERNTLIAKDLLGWRIDPGRPEKTLFWFSPEMGEKARDLAISMGYAKNHHMGWPSNQGFQPDDPYHYLPDFTGDPETAYELEERIIKMLSHDEYLNVLSDVCLNKGKDIKLASAAHRAKASWITYKLANSNVHLPVLPN